MLENFIDSVLIIDDNKEEVEELIRILEEKDIWHKYYHPDECKKKLKSRKIIFIDLHLDSTAGDKLKAHIAKIRQTLKTIISKENNSYGLVVWTNHPNEVIELKKAITSDNDLYLLPLFIVGFSKLKYLKEGYQNLFSDLENILKKSMSANFFINWNNLINKGKDSALISIFNLVPDYQKQDRNLEFLLFKMAQNYTGIPYNQIDGDYPIGIDAIKSFNDLLNTEINQLCEQNVKLSIDNTYITDDNLFSYSGSNNLLTKKKEVKVNKVVVNDEEFKISDSLTNAEKTEHLVKIKNELTLFYSNLNSKLFIDTINVQQDKVIPGNVYEIIDKNSEIIHPKIPESATPIIIEMTPPCDFSNGKSLIPRLLSGYYYDLAIEEMEQKERFYKELWPVSIEGKKKPQIIIFDFNVLGFISKEELIDINKYKLLFRVKDKLFADILQKMTSHMARLGLSIIR